MSLNSSTNLKNIFFGPLKYLLIVIALIFFMGPIFWMITASFKTNFDIMSVKILSKPYFTHYINIAKDPEVKKYLINSLLITIPALVVGILLGVPVAYVISRTRLTFLAPLILIVRMAPGICLLIPIYITFRFIGILGTHLAISISHLLITAPILGWILVSFFEKIPVELEEAAIIDGCSHYSALVRVVLPLIYPGLLSSSLLAFTWSWNNFLLALVLGNNKTYNIPLFALKFFEDYGIDFGGLFAASTIIALPSIIIAIIFQERIVKGMAGGALKG